MRALAASLLLLAGCAAETADQAGEPAQIKSSTPSAGPVEDTLQRPVSAAECGDGETTIFACTLESGKMLSVCSAGGETATYRVGREAPEIELQGGSWARVGYSGGGELQIAFNNGATRYVVFGRTIRTSFSAGETNDPASSDGVVVLKNGRYEGIQLCRSDSGASYYDEESEAAMQRLPKSDELFTDESYRADPAAPDE